MKGFKEVRRLGNDRGVAVILVAGIMVAFLLLFMVVGLEFARMYYVRGQLQNAADAAALAGAKSIVGDSTVPGLAMTDNNVTAYQQQAAREAAWKFACRNEAAGSSVFLVGAGSGSDCNTPPADLNSSNDPNGDIVVGYWNSASSTVPICSSTGLPDRFCPANGFTNNPINALKVRPQRASGLEPARGSVDFLFTGIGNLTGWTKMDVKRVAIADRPPRADAYFAICWQEDILDGACKNPSTGDYCSPTAPCTFSNRTFCTSPTPGTVDPNSQTMGWTSLLSNPTCSSTAIDENLICSDQPSQSVCGKQICVQNGGTSTPKDLEALMYDPLYDSSNKTCVNGGGVAVGCTSSAYTVTGWSVIVPITKICPPLTGGSFSQDIYGYASIHLTAACGSGGGGGSVCSNHPYASPSGACPSDPTCQNNYIKIDSIACYACSVADSGLGGRASLVK